MSTLKVDGIRSNSASSDAITLASDGTCTANITSNGGGQLSNRNMIINGGMMVNQRYGDTANTPADGNYTIDRWQAWMSTGSKFSVTRSDDHPDDFHKSLLVTSLSAATVGADHEHGLTTKIEGHDMARLAFGTSSAKSATLSFYVKSSLTGTFGGLVANSALNMSYVFSYTISSANTWERKTITIPATTSGSFGTGSSNGLQVHFEFGVGSNRTAAVGWQTNTAVRGVNSQVNLIATNAATWRMTGLQLEVGDHATSFEHKSFAQELALCQRYYDKSYAHGTTPGTATDTGAVINSLFGTMAYAGMPVEFSQPMRTNPTVTLYSKNSANTTGKMSADSTDGDAQVGFTNEKRTFAFRGNDNSGTSQNVFLRCQYTAEAEL